MKQNDYLLLGYEKNRADLFVRINNYKRDDEFEFVVMNGGWKGIYKKGYIKTISTGYKTKVFILSSNILDIVGEDYNEILNNFNNKIC